MAIYRFKRKISCALILLFVDTLISGSYASFSNGKSRFQEFHGCNGSAPLPSDTQDDDPSATPAVEPASSSSVVQQTTSSYPQNNYFQPVILGPQSVVNHPPSTHLNPHQATPANEFAIGNRMNTLSFGGNRFSFGVNGNRFGSYNDISEDKVPTLSPATSRLAQLQHSVMAYRNQITGNRFFEMDGSLRFVLYTRKNPSTGQKIQLHNKESVESSDFKADKPTKLIIHGFSDIGALGEWVTNLRDAYLSASEANVIIADFSTYETFLLFWTNLPVFASKRVADLVTFLELTTGTSRENFHLIARSWGTHVAGVTGRLLQGRVGRITGLEPEARVYGSVLPDYKLVSSDAQFVDIVHVNGRRYFFYGSRFGLTPPSGHVDIYPNFAEKNNGCPGTANNYGRFNFGFCQRGRGVSYFTETIKYPQSHRMCQCKSFTEYKSGNCVCTKNSSNSFMGEYISNQTRGVFQLTAPSVSPNWFRMFRQFVL